MKFVPAGVSKKTGNNYNAFFSCSDCHKTSPYNGEIKPQELGKPISATDERIEKMAQWARSMQEKVEMLEKEIQELKNLKTLMYDLTNKSAVDLHASIDPSIPIIDEIKVEDIL